MTLTRYTYKGKGIFRSLHKDFEKADMSVSDEQNLYDAEEVFDRYMEVPDICTDKIVQTRSYFTEEGLKEFRRALDTICYYADLYLEHPVKVKTIDYAGEILYKDYYQVVIPA